MKTKIEFRKRPSNLNTLSKEMHQRSRNAGFWEKNWSNEHCLCLIVSELIEAVEAHRRNKRANVVSFDFGINDVGADFAEAFEHCIKDSIEDELADSVIRLLDLAGARSLDLNRFALNHVVNESKSFTENVFSIFKELAYYKHSLSEQINYVILEIEKLCKIMSIDLWLHIDLKMNYNLNREYKHGKAY